jgi:transcriptional regulator with XRE-family HTH domain
MNATAATLIHEARLRAGLSQRELARRALTSQAVISAYENGRRDPTFDHLREILAATGHTLSARLRPAAAVAMAPNDAAAIDSDEDDDRILENLRLSPARRLRKMGAMRRFAARYRGALPRR